MQSQLICPLCEEDYSELNPPRLLTTCGHTYCEECFKAIMTQKNSSFVVVCPEDGQKLVLNNNSVSSIPKNLALLRIMESKKNSTSFKDSQLELSKIVKSEEPHHDDDDARQIMDAMALSNSGSDDKGTEEKLSLQKQQSTKETQQEVQKVQLNVQQKCKLHNKPLEVVCIKDLKKICASCAIFGEHRGHEFKSLQQIQKQRMAYYSSILQVMQKKDVACSRISNQQTCLSILDILNNKKSKIKDMIIQKFKKLIDMIEYKEKQTLKNLQSLMHKTQIKLKNLMKIDSQTLDKYDEWEEKSYHHIKILEGTDFESKLHLLFAETTDSMDVLDQGEKIIKLMKKQQDSLINEVEQALQNIGVQFNTQIFNYIQSFVDLFDEAKKKKPKSRIVKPQPLVVQTNSNHNINNIKQQSLSNQSVLPVKNSIVSKIKNESQNVKQYVRDHQESLLDLEQVSVKTVKKPEFVKTEQNHLIVPSVVDLQIASPVRRQKDVVSPSAKFIKKLQMNQQLSPRLKHSSKNDESFTQQKNERPNKKRLSKLKLPQKIDKTVDLLISDQLETFDLTNAQLDDAAIILISQFISGTKVKTVKLIRNKLTDEAICKVIPYMKGVITLNISQNMLTQRVLDILIDNREQMQSIKSVILSQNKIMERKAKPKIDKLKALDIVVSI